MRNLLPVLCARPAVIKKILFHRNYQRLTGGHLKVFDYFRHTQSTPGYRAEIYLTPDSQLGHPWETEAGLVRRYMPMEADGLFIAGLDWQALDPYPGIEERIPVINLIQGMRHASPTHPLYRFLRRRATRICVSSEVADALCATGICNGPIHVSPNCINRTLLPKFRVDRPVDVFVSGNKRPDLAKEVAVRLALAGLSVDCAIMALPRSTFLTRMSNAKVAVLLPYEEEGFYMPALEAMAMGTVVICPDCIGNRGFCINEVTALVTGFDAAAIEAAIARIRSSPELAEGLRNRALSVSEGFDIGVERAVYQRILREAA
ncbi:MAG: glycosyltransferase [Rhodocyclaceae bacterium]|nr:glycosyltransferase [Rhodocyclaceae bacterium]